MAENATTKRPQLWHLVISGQARKLSSHLYYHRKSFFTRLGWIFLMFESRLSWDCCIFKHCLSTKSSGASNYCRHEANVRVLESLLCKVLLSFDNSRLIDRALVFLMYCKLGPEQHPLFLLFTHASLNNKIFFLLLSIKNAPFLTKNHRVDYFWRLDYC